MPFRSKAQRAYLFAKHPAIAKRWAKEYPNQKGLPEHAAQAGAAKRQQLRRRGK